MTSHPAGPDSGSYARELARRALAEDGPNDITSEIVSARGVKATGVLEFRSGGVLAGLSYADAVIAECGLEAEWEVSEGAAVSPKRTIGTITGDVADILKAERPMLPVAPTRRTPFMSVQALPPGRAHRLGPLALSHREVFHHGASRRTGGAGLEQCGIEFVDQGAVGGREPAHAGLTGANRSGDQDALLLPGKLVTAHRGGPGPVRRLRARAELGQGSPLVAQQILGVLVGPHREVAEPRQADDHEDERAHGTYFTEPLRPPHVMLRTRCSRADESGVRGGFPGGCRSPRSLATFR